MVLEMVGSLIQVKLAVSVIGGWLAEPQPARARWASARQPSLASRAKELKSDWLSCQLIEGLACRAVACGDSPPAPVGLRRGSLLSLRERRLVGEEVVKLPPDTNALQQGAGENASLMRKSNFGPCPHLSVEALQSKTI